MRPIIRASDRHRLATRAGEEVEGGSISLSIQRIGCRELDASKFIFVSLGGLAIIGNQSVFFLLRVFLFFLRPHPELGPWPFKIGRYWESLANMDSHWMTLAEGA